MVGRVAPEPYKFPARRGKVGAFVEVTRGNGAPYGWELARFGGKECYDDVRTLSVKNIGGPWLFFIKRKTDHFCFSLCENPVAVTSNGISSLINIEATKLVERFKILERFFHWLNDVSSSFKTTPGRLSCFLLR